MGRSHSVIYKFQPLNKHYFASAICLGQGNLHNSKNIAELTIATFFILVSETYFTDMSNFYECKFQDVKITLDEKKTGTKEKKNEKLCSSTWCLPCGDMINVLQYIVTFFKIFERFSEPRMYHTSLVR